MLGEVLRHGCCVAAVLAHAQRHGFKTLDEHEGVERRHGGADVAQKRDARLDDVGDGAQRLDRLRPDRAVVARVRRVEHGKAVGMFLPVEIAAVDDDAADRGAVAADVFRRRVHGDGGAMLDRLAQHRTGRVVHDQRNAELAPDLRHFGDGENSELWVGERLAVIAARPRIAGTAEILRVRRIDEAAFDAHGAHGVLKQIPGAAIDVGRAQKIIAGVTDVLHRKQRRRLPRGETECGHAAFERGDALLQHGLGRIHDAGVDVAELLEREQVGRVLGRTELV